MKTEGPKVAFATFVKTPGMSPIKTRLGASIGEAKALEFYIESLGRTHQLMKDWQAVDPRLHPFWAVAEKSALGALFWQKWPQIWQGEGGLGERIARVYTELKKDFDILALYGADSPHVPLDRLRRGIELLISGDASTVVGPTEDGGFYFLASTLRVPLEIWTQVRYSSEHTLSDLKAVWPKPMRDIETDFDVDNVDDYTRLNGPNRVR